MLLVRHLVSLNFTLGARKEVIELKSHRLESNLSRIWFIFGSWVPEIETQSSKGSDDLINS